MRGNVKSDEPCAAGNQKRHDAVRTASIARRSRPAENGATYRHRTTPQTGAVAGSFWQAWGPAGCGGMRGMFAVGVWGRRSRQLIRPRGRLGENPLDYAPPGSGFLFGSGTKALLAGPGLPRRPNLGAIDQYLTR